MGCEDGQSTAGSQSEPDSCSPVQCNSEQLDNQVRTYQAQAFEDIGDIVTLWKDFEVGVFNWILALPSTNYDLGKIFNLFGPQFLYL